MSSASDRAWNQRQREIEDDDKRLREQAQRTHEAYRDRESEQSPSMAERFDFDGEVDYDFNRSVEEFKPSAIKLATGVADSIYKDGEWRIDDTAAAVGDVFSGVAQQVPGATNLFSMLGIDLDTENAPIPGQIIDALEERYGSVDAFKTTAMEDPAGMLFDFSSIITGGTGMAVKGTSKLSKALATTPKANVAAKAAELATRLAHSTASTISDPTRAVGSLANLLPAESIFKGALELPSGKIGRKRAAELSELAWKKRISGTDTGAAKVARLKEKKINERTKIIDKMDEPVSLDELQQGLPRARAKVREPLDNATASKDIPDFDKTASGAIDDLYTSHEKTLYTPSEAQRFKGAQQAAGRKSYDDPLPSGTMEAHKALASGAQKALEKRNPKIRTVNKDWNDLRELQELIDPAITSSERNARGMMDFGTRSALSPVTGPQGATAAGLAGAQLRGGATTVALLIDKVREGSLTWTAIKQAMVNAGRAEEEIKELETEIRRIMKSQEQN